MQPQGGEISRHALFSTLAAFANAPCLLLDDRLGVEYANDRSRELLECADDAAFKSRWNEIGPLFGTPPAPGESGPIVLDAHVTRAGREQLLGLELHALEPGTGGGYFGLLKDRGTLDPLERELLLASECRGWVHQGALFLHDLKGVLNSMQISLELLADPDPDRPMSPEDAKRERRVRVLKEDLAKMNVALRALPGTDAAAEPRVEDFDVREVVRDILATLRLLVRRHNVDLAIDLPEAALPVRGRRAWVRRALFNATVHRLNAMRAGGRLEVSAVPTGEGTVVRLGHDAAEPLDGLLAQSQRAICTGRRGANATDLMVARAICEAEGGSLRIVNDAASRHSIIELTFRR